MNVDDLAAWRTAVQSAADSIVAGFEPTYGYPPGRNGIDDPDEADAGRLAAASSGIPEDLVRLYTAVGAVSLPDVGNGLFVHSAALVASQLNEYLWRVTGRHAAEVVVFASDGGGTLYALARPGGSPVYRLPPDLVTGGVYDSNNATFNVVAEDLGGFLDLMRQAVERFAATGAVVDL